MVERLPLPEYAIALGETEQAAGRLAAAKRDYALVGAEVKLLHANGVNTDVDLALFEANHGSSARAVSFGRRAWQQAPSVRSADAYAWALYRAGRIGPATRFSEQAMRLGSRDPSFLYHAGMIARARRAKPRRRAGCSAPSWRRARASARSTRRARGGRWRAWDEPAPAADRRSPRSSARSPRSLFAAAPSAFAHPLGNFTINQLAQVRIGDREAQVHYILDQAEIPTFQQLQRYDADGSGAIDTAAEESQVLAKPARRDLLRARADGERADRCRSAHPRTRSSASRPARAGCR